MTGRLTLPTRDVLAFVVDGWEDYVGKARYDQQRSSGSDPYDHIGGAHGR